MSNTSQVKNREGKQKNTGWDVAIADAREKIRKLKRSIEVFAARKRVGDPWPGKRPV
jgi:hypothetical protein